MRPQACDQTILIDTRLTTPPDGAGAPWVERWTYDQCTTKADVDMTFTPSAKGGTTWSASLVK